MPSAASGAAAAALVMLAIALVQPGSPRSDRRPEPVSRSLDLGGEPGITMAGAGVEPLAFDWAARWLDERTGRRELVELWRVRDHGGNSIFIEARIVITCEPAVRGDDLRMRLRQYPD